MFRKASWGPGPWRVAAVASKTSLCFCIIFRYLRRLHSSLKKGRWTPKEEEKLAELIEKHGVGEAQGALAPLGCGRPCARAGPGALPRSQAAASADGGRLPTEHGVAATIGRLEVQVADGKGGGVTSARSTRGQRCAGCFSRKGSFLRGSLSLVKPAVPRLALGPLARGRGGVP